MAAGGLVGLNGQLADGTGRLPAWPGRLQARTGRLARFTGGLVAGLIRASKSRRPGTVVQTCREHHRPHARGELESRDNHQHAEVGRDDLKPQRSTSGRRSAGWESTSSPAGGGRPCS